MEVRLLTEATSVDDSDWLYIQKDNGLPRKVKKSNLVPQVQQQQSTQIITSATPPSNPQLGMVWNEVDSQNNLIQQWNWLNNSAINKNTWLSGIFYFHHIFANGSSIYLETDSRFDYLIRKFSGSYRPNNNMTTGQRYEIILSRGNHINLFTTSGKIKTITFENQTTAQHVKKEELINVLVNTSELTTNPINQLIGIGSAGYSTTGVNSSYFTYQLVRK